ncbi:helix-turn-helix domain-containing protein [Amycolatopsis magusensis]|uniref:helix-turn-helix domain-containing protein n=1 Tax=Amycolatopsis magusensis TaxID=882444 RepID=UPI0024A9A39A|nr:helix-turn-helix transcriptional regulator [Amycolatopsis magusensis]MDI5975941.1 helix-turn-helix transcriptional regulator [Amycolatopsis magusensis]
MPRCPRCLHAPGPAAGSRPCACRSALAAVLPAPPRLAPALGMWSDPASRAALTSGHLHLILRAYRRANGLSLTAMSELTGYDPSYLGHIENERRIIADIGMLRYLAATLGLPAHLLGVTDPDHGDFAGLVQFGGSVIRLAEKVRGGLCRAAAVAQLHQVRRLEDAVCTAQVHIRLLVAVAELASMAGWMAYDVDDHDAARRLWTYALDTARRAEDHVRAPDLAVDVLLDMAHQALHLHSLDPKRAHRPRERGPAPGPARLGYRCQPPSPGQHHHPGLQRRRAGVVPGGTRRGRPDPARHRRCPEHLRRRRPGHDPALGLVRHRRRGHRPAGGTRCTCWRSRVPSSRPPQSRS